MKQYKVRIEERASFVGYFTDEDIEGDDTPEVAAIELLMADGFGPDPFEDTDYDVTILEVDER